MILTQVIPGCTFVVLTISMQVIMDVVFSVDSMHTELLVISKDSVANTFSAAYGTLESRRALRVSTVNGPAFFYILINNAKAIHVLRFKNGEYTSGDHSGI